MIEFFVGPYCLILWLVFWKFKLIPINTWTMVGAFLIGAFGFTFLLLMMNMYQPLTKDARFMAATTPIISEVRGRVIEVPVKGNEPLKTGDVLFKIDPAPFKQQLASIDAQLGLARTRLKQESGLVAQGAGNQYEVQQFDAEVKRLSAELEQARIDLENTTVRAPTNGYVTQVILRPGMMAVPMPFSQLMTFVHEEQAVFVAAFRQNSLQGIDPGDDVEVTFNAVPGDIFAGKVKQILPIMSEGQATASGRLLNLEDANEKPGRVLVQIQFTDDLTGLKLPVGATGVTTVYTGQFNMLKIVRMLILRITAWENYVFTA